MNRKRSPSPVRLGRALKVLLACLCLAAPALGYLQQKTKLNNLGIEHRDLELKLEGVMRDNKARSRTLDSLKTPARLEAAVRELNLGLVPPSPNQIVRLGGREQSNPSEPTWRGDNRQVASNH